MFVTQSQQLSALARVERAHVELMAHPSTMEYSGVFMVGKYRVTEDVPTACTNGIDCLYGKAFVERLTDAELRGVIMHENLHKCFQHMFLWKHLFAQNGRIANMACDYVINLIIKDLEHTTQGYIVLPKDALIDPQYRGMDSQEVFNKLLENADSDDGEGDEDGEEGQEGQDGNGGGGFDQHDWESADKMSQEEVDQVTKDINQAIRQGQLMAGKLGGNQSRELGALTEPKVDWREQLRDFLNSLSSGGDISTWQRVSRRWLQHDVYMPSTLSETMGRVVIGVDTSGSIGGPELQKFLSEVQAVCRNVSPELVDLIYWDADVARHEVYGRDQQDKLVQSTKPAGGGGTDPRCVVEYMKEKNLRPECVIMLSDGYVPDWGKWGVPVLWALTTKGITSPVGSTIHID